MGFEGFNLLVIFGLISLFVISFTMFIKKMVVNTTTTTYETNELGKKLDIIIEQNNRIIALMEKED
ncbi:DUF4083 family protein [Ornithinibacillus halotolerans]|uniref:DUF4083 domain-containing protein n=1 Tax=Ornithinibacillus halotolerans TaxID=1274357 RepID=A0A916RRF8_9BACI|nr:DUF4083 family protein [Ornithinibacillus halotolerans]GGA67567.1 hypothetical protein GCM10008025_09250 [Ornithinibacillus halotolerans]